MIEALRLDPKNAGVLIDHRGNIWRHRGASTPTPSRLYEAAVQLDPKLAVASARPGLALGDVPDGFEPPKREEGGRSATRACGLHASEDPHRHAPLFDTYAELGEFLKAVGYGEKAVALKWIRSSRWNSSGG